jgi:phosphoribosylglycinamide formyltransferase 1
VKARRPVRIAVFASGEGSNLGALLARFPPGGDPEVALVVSDRPGIGALRRAAHADVPSAIVRPRDFASSDAFGEALLALLRDRRIDLLVLAGYLRKLPAAVVGAFAGRAVNVHPALLPAFGGPGMYGARVHAAVLAEGAAESGASVHFVDAEYDRGPVIARAHVPVLAGDTVEELGARVLAAEHELLPDVVARVARGDVRLGPGGEVEWRAPLKGGGEVRVESGFRAPEPRAGERPRNAAPAADRREA